MVRNAAAFRSCLPKILTRQKNCHGKCHAHHLRVIHNSTRDIDDIVKYTEYMFSSFESVENQFEFPFTALDLSNGENNVLIFN